MRIARVDAVNFRCLKELSTSLDDVTVLVGANGTGNTTLHLGHTYRVNLGRGR